MGLSVLTDRLAFRSKKMEKMIEGEPVILIHNGRIHQKNMDKEKITESELKESLRKSEVLNVDEVQYAILETDGKISVIKNKRD